MEMKRILAILATAVVAMAGCKSENGNSPAPQAPPPVAMPAQSTSAPESPAPTETSRAGLPDPKLTPGERSSNPSKRSNLDPEVVKKVLLAYAVAPGDPRNAVCRLIPPEIGGTGNAPNLFVTTRWFSGLKARLDKKLVELVNSNQITAEQAESDLKSNWVKAAHKYYVRNYGEGDKSAARKKEDANRW